MVAPAIAGAAIGAAADLAGGIYGSYSSGKQSDQDWKRQKKVLQNQITWRVADAKRAGIHPLYALGAPTMNYASTVGGGGDPMSSALSNMGQNISRAVAAQQTPVDREIERLTLEKAGLENDYLRGQIASQAARTLQGIGPAMPGKINVGGTPIDVDPNATPANVAQNQWGEPADWLVGGLNMVRDHDNTLRKWFMDTMGIDLSRYTPSNIDVIGRRKNEVRSTPHVVQGESW